MKFSVTECVRWHDTDCNRELSPSGWMRMMQEAANLQLKENGMSLDSLRDERGLAFLISRMAVQIEKPIYSYDEVTVETWITESRGLAFNRCYEVFRNGESIGRAFSVWALRDLRENCLVPANRFQYSFEGDYPIALELPVRLHLPANAPMDRAGTRTIVYSDVDYNGHMNNTNYPDMLCDFIPGIREKRVTGFILSFLREAPFGKTLQILSAVDAEGTLFRTENEAGDVCLEAKVFTRPRTDLAGKD